MSSASKLVTVGVLGAFITAGVVLLSEFAPPPGSVDLPLWLELLPVALLIVLLWIANSVAPMRFH